MVHNLGVLQHAFAFGIWAPFAETWTERLTLEALDSGGNISQATVECASGDEGNWEKISICCDGSKPLTAMPTAPPISIQLEEARMSGATLRARGWIAARSGIVRAAVAAGGTPAGAILRQREASATEGHDPLANAIQDFAAELRLDARQEATQVEVVAASVDGAEYYGAFLIDRAANAPVVTSNLKPVNDNGYRGPGHDAVIYVEYPRVENGVAVLQERQQFRLAGWAVARREIERLNIYMDGKLVGNAAYGAPRPDVVQVFPQWPNAVSSGFNLLIDSRSLVSDAATIMLEAHLRGGGEEKGRFHLLFADGVAEDRFLDTLFFEEEIWRFARTLKMFAAGREDAILAELLEKAAMRKDPQEGIRIQRIRAAVVTLADAWSGRQIDRKVARFLKEHGFLW
jgi:hypothetical protein